MFGDSDKVGIDVVPLHGRPHSCMPNPVEDRLEVYEDIVEVLLVLEIFLAKDSSVEDLLCSAPSRCEACLFFSGDPLRLRLQYVRCDLQRDFALMGGEADRLVVLALLQVVCLRKCDGQGLGLRGWPFFCLPDLCCGLSS